jgi:hypothetical protein
MTIYPLVFHLGPLEVTGYGLMLMVAFLMGGWLIARQLRERQLREDYAADIVAAAVIGGIIGAKLWYVALTRDPGALFSGTGRGLRTRPGRLFPGERRLRSAHYLALGGKISPGAAPFHRW